jgi:DNA-binding LacI/PurR family transcriptional regulator
MTIVCFTNQQALAEMTALKSLEIKIPQDISIIGNDNIYIMPGFILFH